MSMCVHVICIVIHTLYGSMYVGWMNIYMCIWAWKKFGKIQTYIHCVYVCVCAHACVYVCMIVKTSEEKGSRGIV